MTLDTSHPGAACESVGADEPALPGRSVRRRHIHEPASASMTLNMTPMIDVVFLLLIYFVLGAQFALSEESIGVDGPARSRHLAAAPDPFELPQHPVVIRVRSLGDAPGQFALHSDDPAIGPVTSTDELSRAAASFVGSSSGDIQQFIIAPETGTRWEHTLDVLAALHSAGVVNVRFLSPQGNGAEP